MIKVTKREKFEMLLAIPTVKENKVLVEFIERELELLAKKSGKATSGAKTLSPAQKVNEEIKVMIMQFMHGREPVQIKDITIGNFSSQKLSALVRQLLADGLVERIEEKKIAKFKLAPKEVGQEE